VSSHLELAREAVRDAAALLANARPDQIRSKGNPRDLVTEWDVRAEQVIRARLAPSGIPILGEEGGLTGEGEHELRWVVDPIDGTVNFAHGLPIWTIAIALERSGTTLVGVVFAPVLGWWFEAEAGGGARDANGAPLSISAQPRLDQALLSTGFPYDRATNPINNFAEWEQLQRVAGACRRLGCASLDLCLVARGWLDGYWERHLKAWDVAAGALIVTEAGGTVTNTTGGPFDPHAGEVVASNGAIHTELVAELGRAVSRRAPSKELP
jgi:myo-inositol-1(or 4)-monophosphatase